MLEVFGWIFCGLSVLVLLISAIEPLFKRIK